MTSPDWPAALFDSVNDPLVFVTGVIGATPEDWQAEALSLVGGNDRVAIRSGHGIGKTTLLAWIILWFVLTRIPAGVLVCANSQDQLKGPVWKTLRHWWKQLPPELLSSLEMTGEQLWLKDAPEENYAVARTASRDNPEALQGYHSENMLIVLEEASGIPEAVIEVGHGTLSTPGAKVLMVGNPTRRSGFFHDVFSTSLRDRWKTMHVSSEDVPRARGHIDDIITRYGKDSNQYRVRVSGDFPIEDDDVVIPLHLLEAAVGRDVGPVDDYHTVWGVDVALYGDDRSALAKRKGNHLLEPVKSWRNKDPSQSAAILKNEYEKTKLEDRPSEILVDVIGPGAGVVSSGKLLRIPVRGVNVSESPSNGDEYYRLRDELYFKMRDWFQGRDGCIPDDDALIGELANIHYDVDEGTGKTRVESKKEMKKLINRSPDLGDAFLMTFAGGMDRKHHNVKERYKSKVKVLTSWMSA